MTLEGPARDETAIPPAHLRAIPELLAKLGHRALGEPEPVPDSITAHNYLVATDGGRLFLKFHRAKRTRDRIRREHRIARFAGERGIPVALPLADAAGATTWSIGGGFVSAYPAVAGRHLERDAIDAARAEALGALHGRLHAVLAAYEDEGLSRERTDLAWDTEASIAALSRVDDLIRYYPAPGPWRLQVQGWLREQLELLESGEPRPVSDFAALPVQPIHGDYHARNVILAGDEPAAVVDWELACLAPPVFEVLRSLSYSGLLDAPDLIRAYLRGYRQHARLAPADCAPGVEQWWQSQLHETWAYRRSFIEGDRRADRFFESTAARLRALRDPAFRASLTAELESPAT